MWHSTAKRLEKCYLKFLTSSKHIWILIIIWYVKRFFGFCFYTVLDCCASPWKHFIEINCLILFQVITDFKLFATIFKQVVLNFNNGQYLFWQIWSNCLNKAKFKTSRIKELQKYLLIINIKVSWFHHIIFAIYLTIIYFL